jgi:hypothetical protein
MKSLKELKNQADIAWVKYMNAYQTSYQSEENLHLTIQLKLLYDLAEEAFNLQKIKLDNQQKV